MALSHWGRPDQHFNDWSFGIGYRNDHDVLFIAAIPITQQVGTGFPPMLSPDPTAHQREALGTHQGREQVSKRTNSVNNGMER